MQRISLFCDKIKTSTYIKIPRRRSLHTYVIYMWSKFCKDAVIIN